MVSIDVPVGVKLVLPHLTQLPCIESLRRRLLCPCVLPFSLHSVHAKGLAFILSLLYCTRCDKCFDYAGILMSHLQGIYSWPVTGCKSWVRAKIYAASHKPNTISCFHKFISICTPAKRLTSVRLLAVDIVHCLQLAWPGTFPWHITTPQVIHGSVTGCGH